MCQSQSFRIISDLNAVGHWPFYRRVNVETKNKWWPVGILYNEFFCPILSKNSRVKGQNECEEDGDGDLSHMAQEPGALVLKIVHVSPQPSYQWFLVNILTPVRLIGV